MCTTLKTFSLKKISFPFWTRYVDDTFTLIGTSRHNVDQILQTMNSINNNIQFTCEIENNDVLFFLDTFVSRTDGGFSASAYRKNFAIFFPPYARFRHPPSKKNLVWLSHNFLLPYIIVEEHFIISFTFILNLFFYALWLMNYLLL